MMNDLGGGQGPERAFITRLTGGRRAGWAASGRAGKEAVAGRRIREAYSSPTAPSAPGSSPRPWYLLDFLKLSLLPVGAGHG